jgi:hypothetical protein
MTDPTARNRLDEEASPYLRQHADNPVNWQPWDEEALAAARERDVPIFLSIGYSACHWCHVMEEESFQDPAVADLLNEAFVPIKVDREERPDVDEVYMTIAQLVTGSGGWPLSVWLTPEGKPFYVGTYFPPESRHNTPGFRPLLADIADSWSDPDQREEMERRADQWTDALTDRLEDTPADPGDPPGADVVGDAVRSILRGADREYGGFTRSGPKFPQPTRVELLVRAAAEFGSEEALSVALETLDAMCDGGTYDHVGGGFHRYATDRQWRVPHFEKMLYDNAELPRVALDAYQLTGEERYARVVRETLTFVDRELRHPEGGFFATLDARSEGEEGKFYVWTPRQVRAAVDDGRTATLFCERFGITESGNLEGRSVPYLARSVADLADEFDLSVEAVRERLAAAREQVFAARGERPRPARDEKVLAGWNGLMISTLARAELVLGGSSSRPDAAGADAVAGEFTREMDFGEEARRTLGFVREHLYDESTGRLARRYIDGDVKGEGYLEDYAFLARGAFDTYQATGDVEQLAFALELARTIRAEFFDAEAGTLYDTPESGERLVARPKSTADRSTPSSLGVATRTLARLAAFAPDAGFDGVVETVLATHGDDVRASPAEHGSLALAAAEHAAGIPELTLAVEELPDEWRATLADRYLPGGMIARRPPTEAGLAAWLDRLDLAEAPPIWAGRDARDGPTVYACESFTCSPPQSSLADALDWFLDDAGDGDPDGDAGRADGDGERDGPLPGEDLSVSDVVDTDGE